VRTEAAILASRDDAQRAIERTGEELGRSLAALTEARVGDLRRLTEDELRAMRGVLAEANASADLARGRIAGLEKRATASEGKASDLLAAFKGAEEARDSWQRRQDGATRNYRLELDAHLQQMEELLNEKVSANRSDVVRLGRSNVALAAIVHQCRSRIAQLASQEEAADLWRLRLEVHAEALAKAGALEESTASVERPYLLSVTFQKFLSSAVQNVAELLALLADNDTVRAVIVHPEPADDDLGWDRMVDATRSAMARDFVAKVYGLVARTHPNIHPVVLQARTKIFTKIELALKIALSKHQVTAAVKSLPRAAAPLHLLNPTVITTIRHHRFVFAFAHRLRAPRPVVCPLSSALSQAVRAADTILGRRPLDACAACNRPMTKTATQLNEGDHRAVPSTPMTGSRERPHTASFSPGRQRPGKGDGPVGVGSLHWAAAQSQASASAPPSLSLGHGGGQRVGGDAATGALVASRGGGGGYQGQGAGGAYVMRGGFRMPKKAMGSSDSTGLPDIGFGGTAGGMAERPGTAPASPAGGRGRY